MHLYAHDFVQPLGFLFGIDKNNKKRLKFPFTLQSDLEFPTSECANILVTLLQFGIVV